VTDKKVQDNHTASTGGWRSKNLASTESGRGESLKSGYRRSLDVKPARIGSLEVKDDLGREKVGGVGGGGRMGRRVYREKTQNGSPAKTTVYVRLSK